MASNSSVVLAMAITAEAAGFSPSLACRGFALEPITIVVIIGTGSTSQVLIDRLGCC